MADPSLSKGCGHRQDLMTSTDCRLANRVACCHIARLIATFTYVVHSVLSTSNVRL
jgi:hypothetical protein